MLRNLAKVINSVNFITFAALTYIYDLTLNTFNRLL